MLSRMRRYRKFLGDRIGYYRKFLRSRIDYFRFVYGSEWKYVLGLGAIGLGFLVSVLPTAVVGVVGVVGAVATIILLIADTTDVYRRWRGIELTPIPVDPETEFSELKGAAWRNEKGGPAGHFIKFPAQCDDDWIWIDPDVQKCLPLKAKASRVVMLAARYRLPA